MRRSVVLSLYPLILVLLACHSNPPIRKLDRTIDENTGEPKLDLVQHVAKLRLEYDTLATRYFLNHATFDEARRAFKQAVGMDLEPTRIAFYVPGKIPREDGHPYFLLDSETSYGISSEKEGYCLEGWFSLADTNFNFNETYCGPIH